MTRAKTDPGPPAATLLGLHDLDLAVDILKSEKSMLKLEHILEHVFDRLFPIGRQRVTPNNKLLLRLFFEMQRKPIELRRSQRTRGKFEGRGLEQQILELETKVNSSIAKHAEPIQPISIFRSAISASYAAQSVQKSECNMRNNPRWDEPMINRDDSSMRRTMLPRGRRTPVRFGSWNADRPQQSVQ